tara:strand:+ start:1526 stop:3148 length:1623 start_codon:yes stop_codon:yes gene_type:complete
MNIKEIIKKSESLKANRTNWVTNWQHLAEIFDPQNATFKQERAKGDKKKVTDIYESQPMLSANTLKSIVVSLFFNRNINPIQFTAIDKEVAKKDDVKKWIESFTDTILSEMFKSKSNFEISFSQAILDLIIYGTSGTFIQEGKKATLNYKTISVKNFLISEDSEGFIDCVILSYKMTKKQLLDKWGNDKDAKLTDKIRNEKDDNKEFDIELIIYPRESYDEKKLDQLNMTIAGKWYEVDKQSEIKEIGFSQFPFAVARSEKATQELYGTSRGLLALADSLQVQEVSKQHNNLVEKKASPPLVVDGEAFDDPINLRAAAVNYVKPNVGIARSPVEPLVVVGDIREDENLMSRKFNTIEKVFFLDKLKIFDDPRATATQVLELRAESYRIMGEFAVGIMQFTEDLLNSTFDIIFKRVYDENGQLIVGNGLFNKELPEEIKGKELKVIYNNPVTQSQKMNQASMIEKFIGNVSNLAQVQPQVLDLIDFDKITKKYGDILDIDAHLYKNENEVKQVRDKRAKQQKQMQSLEQGKMMGEIAKTQQ